MKRIVAILLLVTMLLGIAMLPGCTGGNKKVQEVLKKDFVIPEGGYNGEPVTITFYHTMGQNLRDVLDAFIVVFNKLYPNIKVEHEQVGGYTDVRDQI